MEDLLNRIISKLDNLEQGQKELGDRLDNRIDNLETSLDKLDNRMDKFDDRMDKLDNRLDKIDIRLDKMDDRLDTIDNRIDKLEIRMENEVFDKMAALFDGYLHNAEVLAEHTIILERIEDKISSHDIQIQVLDKTKSNKRKVK